MAEQKFKPILFSTPMVIQIIPENKTQTRRTKGLENINEQPDKVKFVRFQEYPDGSLRAIFQHEDDDNPGSVKCPYKKGDIIWVRETWKPKCFAGCILDGYDYKADHVKWLENNGMKFIKGSGCEQGEVWKPSIFMPKDACRIFLEITDVKVERLHDISEEDAKAEGVSLHKSGERYLNYTDQKAGITQFIYNCHTAKESFKTLWVLINGFRDEQYAWFKNPFVWVVSFKKIGKPENFK